MKLTKRISELTDAEFKYARQLGVRHIIGYFLGETEKPYWEFLDLVRLRQRAAGYGLELAAMGSPPRPLMKEIMEGGPNRDEAIRHVCACIRNMGKAGIPILGYNFSILPNWGRWRQGLDGGGRGDAGLMSFDYDLVKDAPLTEFGPVSHEEVWGRLTYFLERVIPVAEEAGVKLACHPDDPPVPMLRGVAQILYSVDGLKRLVETVPSPSNGLTFCQGTVAEMGVDVFDAIRYFGTRKKIFIVHFRNVHRFPGDSLKYDETFIDEGDVDMLAALRLYAEIGYDGLIDPDHAPVMVGDRQWGRERGYAFALGYMTAAKQMLERGEIPT